MKNVLTYKIIPSLKMGWSANVLQYLTTVFRPKPIFGLKILLKAGVNKVKYFAVVFLGHLVYFGHT